MMRIHTIRRIHIIRRIHAIRKLCTAGVLVVLVMISAPVLATSAAMLYQEGLFEESAVGDLRKAIEIYEEIVTHHPDDARITGNAQRRIAMCWERLGESEKAMVSYRKVIQRFSGEDILAEVERALRRIEASRTIPSSEELPVVYLEGGRGISGTIKDTEGHPVTDAYIRISGVTFPNELFMPLWDSPTYQTDKEGRYIITNLKEGQYVLRIWSDGLASQAQIANVEAGREAADVVMGLTSSLSGRVTDTEGRPIPGAQVRTWMRKYRHRPGEIWYDEYVAVADRGGEVHLEGLPFRFGWEDWSQFDVPKQGIWVLIRADGYVTKFRSQWFGYGEHKEGVDVQLESGGLPIAGVVRDESGLPVVGAEVGLCPVGKRADYGGQAITGEGGRFVLDGNVADLYDIVVLAGGFAPAYMKGVLGGREDLEVVLTRGGVITGSVREHISGLGTLSIPGRPLSDVVVVADHSSNRLLNSFGMTDEDGVYRIGNLTPGSYRMRVDVRRSTGILGRLIPSGERRVDVLEGQVFSGVDVFLKPGMSVSGRVMYRDTGEPAGNLSIRLVGRGWLEATTDEEGRYGFGGVEPGRYWVRANVGGYAEVPRHLRVQVKEDEDVEGADLELVKRSRVTLTVRDPEGHPVSGATVRYVGPDRTTDQEGRCAFKEIHPENRNAIFVDHPDYAYAVIDSVVLHPGQHGSLAVRLRPGRALEGTVTDWDDQPVDGARVLVRPYGSSSKYLSSSFGREVTTDRRGHYRVERLPPETAWVIVVDEGLRFAPTEAMVSVRGDTILTRWDLRVRPGGTVTGRVVDAEGVPVSGVRVYLTPWRVYSQRIITDDEGTYRAERVAAGTYRVSTTFTWWGGPEEGEPVRVEDDRTVKVDLTVE